MDRYMGAWTDIKVKESRKKELQKKTEGKKGEKHKEKIISPS
jgi:hypothetical protein